MVPQFKEERLTALRERSSIEGIHREKARESNWLPAPNEHGLSGHAVCTGQACHQCAICFLRWQGHLEATGHL